MRGAEHRRYRVEWLEGYDPTEPHEMLWFDPAGSSGFNVDDAKAVLGLAKRLRARSGRRNRLASANRVRNPF